MTLQQRCSTGWSGVTTSTSGWGEDSTTNTTATQSWLYVVLACDERVCFCPLLVTLAARAERVHCGGGSTTGATDVGTCD